MPFAQLKRTLVAPCTTTIRGLASQVVTFDPWPFDIAAGRTCRRGPEGADTNNWYPCAVGKNTSFSLGEHFSAFIEEQVASGRYASASDVVRTALRLLEDRETRIRTLRRALIAGEKSGESTPFDFEAFVARKRAAKPRHP